MTKPPRGLLDRPFDVANRIQRRSRLREARHLHEAPIGATRSFTASYTGPFRPDNSGWEPSTLAAAGPMIHLHEIHGWVRESDRLFWGGPGGKFISLTYRKVRLARQSDGVRLHQNLGYHPPPETYSD